MSYKIEFYLSDDTLEFTDEEVFNVKESPQELTGTTFFKPTSKKITFEAFEQDFYEIQLIPDDGMYKNISNYTVKIYFDNSLIFTGIIDLSQLSFDVKQGIYKITCFDYLYFFKIYTDIEIEMPNDIGIDTYELCSEYIFELRAKTGLDLTLILVEAFDQYTIDTEELIHYLDPIKFYERLKDDAPAPPTYCYSYDEFGGTPNWLRRGKVRFKSNPEYASQPQLVVIGMIDIVAILEEAHYGYSAGTELHQYAIREETYQYYNTTGWEIRDDLTKTMEFPWLADPWYSWYGMSNQEYANLIFDLEIEENGLDSAVYTFTDENGDTFKWRITDWVDQWGGYYFNSYIGGNVCLNTSATRYPVLTPDYEITFDDEENEIKIINLHDVLMAHLLYFGYTIKCHSNNHIRVINKNPSEATPTVIDRQDIIEHKISNLVVTDDSFSDYSALKGNNEFTQKLHKIINYEEQNNLKELNLDVIGDYDLEIADYITDPITNEDYMIHSIWKDRRTNKYLLKCIRKK